MQDCSTLKAQKTDSQESRLEQDYQFTILQCNHFCVENSLLFGHLHIMHHRLVVL